MKRLSILIVIAGLAAAAAVVNPPSRLDPPRAATTTTLIVGEERDARFFLCPWAFTDGVADSSIALVSRAATDYLISLALNGEVSTADQSTIAAGGAASIEISSIQPVGSSSLIVESGQGPAAAGVLASGDSLIAGDACPSGLPDIWHVGGGSTAEGDLLTLRLFNPFADAARVNLTAVSELGAEAVSGFEGVSIPARSTRTIDLAAALPGREVLSMFVENVEGSVIPALVREAGGDLAMWPGVGQSEVWEVPLTADRGLDGSIVLTNSSLLPVTFSVDVFGRQATVTNPFTGEIAGPGQTVIPLDSLDADVFGARITGDGPFAAVVVGVGDEARAAMPAARTTSSAWLLPGVNTRPDASYRMWVLNTGVDDIVVSYRAAGSTGSVGEVDQLAVAAGAVASVDVNVPGAAGLIVETAGPFSVAWSVISAPAVAYVAGVPIGG